MKYVTTESSLSLVMSENLLETGSLLIPSLKVYLLVILGAVNCEEKNSLEIT